MSSITLTATPDGPHRLESQVTIFDRVEQPIPDRGAPVFLCRRGRSADKPFGGGSHARTGWKEHA